MKGSFFTPFLALRFFSRSIINFFTFTFYVSCSPLSLLQEGVVEVKEVLKDAVEHLPDGHRLVTSTKTMSIGFCYLS